MNVFCVRTRTCPWGCACVPGSPPMEHLWAGGRHWERPGFNWLSINKHVPENRGLCFVFLRNESLLTHGVSAGKVCCVQQKYCFIFLVGFPAGTSLSTEALFLKTCFYSRTTPVEITAVSYHFGYENSACSDFISFNRPSSCLAFSPREAGPDSFLRCIFFCLLQQSEINA